MRRILVLVVLSALLLCGCANRAAPAPELVLDNVPTGLVVRKPLSPILPHADGVLIEVASGPAGSCYEAPDGQCFWYTTVSGPDPDAALRELTGTTRERLCPVCGTRFGMEEYRFSWTMENDEGTWLCMGQLHCGTDYCYGLAVCRREDADAETRARCAEVYADYGLYYDEGA